MERCAEINLGGAAHSPSRRTSFQKRLKKCPENSKKIENNTRIIAENTPETGLSLVEKYRCLTEFGTQILCLFDGKNGCTYLSQNVETITGWKQPALLGKKFFGIIDNDFRARLKEALAAPAEAGKPYRLRGKLRHADKNREWYEFTLHMQSAGGHVAIIENIHDNMQTQHTLQKAKLEAELALRTRSEFLASMSHELRTPLNAVIGFSQIIESQMFGKIDNPQYLDYIQHIQESGYDLLTKIEDLLDIASIDAGRVQIAREEVLASDLLRHVVEAQIHHANTAKATLKAEAPENDVLLFIDRRKLQHVLVHLTANAIRFSHEGAGVAVAAAASEKGEITLSVRDAGCGMSEERLSGITSALDQEHCWTSDSSRSIGLGLALTREFVALHGGSVRVQSREGEGTTVEITLPPDCVRAIATPARPEYLLQAAN
ncbi:MAG: PAS domain-containing sensor histidine kinase [Pseudomonadota bacterium]|nr:PAS domain-containing sensor histidine kinase [Pseudomonadota bacterium]MDE3037218.1 PAS domain-containing sensor histidine kinase [Pseudomonadota bacterium]